VDLKVHFEIYGISVEKCSSKRKILIERPDIVNWRCNFFKKLKNIEKMDEKFFT
jgi:hypothetical protein